MVGILQIVCLPTPTACPDRRRCNFRCGLVPHVDLFSDRRPACSVPVLATILGFRVILVNLSLMVSLWQSSLERI
jgi:hypothetical protein